MRDFTQKYFHLNSSAVYNSSAIKSNMWTMEEVHKKNMHCLHLLVLDMIIQLAFVHKGSSVKSIHYMLAFYFLSFEIMVVVF